MELDTFMTWLSDDAETVLQRDDVFAMLTWKDLNQPQALGLSAPVVASLFFIGAVLPLIVFY